MSITDRRLYRSRQYEWPLAADWFDPSLEELLSKVVFDQLHQAAA